MGTNEFSEWVDCDCVCSEDGEWTASASLSMALSGAIRGGWLWLILCTATPAATAVIDASSHHAVIRHRCVLFTDQCQF